MNVDWSSQNLKSNSFCLQIYKNSVALNPNDTSKCLAIGDCEANVIDLESGKISRKLFEEIDQTALGSKRPVLNKVAADPFDQRVFFLS